MQELIAGLQKMRFDFEIVLEQQSGIPDVPFSGMDKSGSAVCEYFVKGECVKDNLCPLRHSNGAKSVVCKHWLRGLCKMGDQCEFLHEYDMTKMPRCFFYSKYGECSKRECPFLHIDSEVKIHDCPWYGQGFCKNGPLCKNKHTKKVMCVNYLVGFCSEGTGCNFSQ
ncbi:cleavage and polyadenylation specificity factor subunit 4-like [Amblyraja radiata]|uniref:cleavage and polyadenylation specificity factor subunit 4-like n=1 Tax=Amblyraja radiata TaxID=386614 RepID=UPI0014039C46|nr:cleavage and polyadenylation specificity factor subunit 4-like [Amblyraja radiata]